MGYFAPTLHEVSSERPVSAPLKYVPDTSGFWRIRRLACAAIVSAPWTRASSSAASGAGQRADRILES